MQYKSKYWTYIQQQQQLQWSLSLHVSKWAPICWQISHVREVRLSIALVFCPLVAEKIKHFETDLLKYIVQHAKYIGII